MGIEFIECYTPPEDVVTCSVKLDFSELADYSYDGVIFHVAYTELGNNGIRFAYRTRFDNFQTEMTLENVVMGSVMYLSSKISIAPRYDVDTSEFTPIWYERGAFCLVPEAEDLTIQFYYDVNEAVDAKPEQVVKGVKFVGANRVVEEGEMPIIEVAAPSMTAVVEEGDLYVEACNDQAEGYSRGGKAYNNANIYLTVDGGEATATCKLSNGQNVAIKKSVDRGSLPPPVMVFDTKTGVVQAIVSFEEGGTMGYIDYTSGTSGTYDVSKHIDTSIIKGGETLFGKKGTMEAASLTNGTGWYRNANYIYVEPYVSKGYSDGIYDQWYCDARTLDANLIPANIAEGTSIFGITGTHKGGSEIKTCTVNVTFSKNAGITLISATTFENGTISVVNQRVSDKNSGQSFSIPNVVCGSALSINTEYIVSFYGSFDKYYHGFSLGGTITVPTAPGTYTVEVGELDD